MVNFGVDMIIIDNLGTQYCKSNVTMKLGHQHFMIFWQIIHWGVSCFKSKKWTPYTGIKPLPDVHYVLHSRSYATAGCLFWNRLGESCSLEIPVRRVFVTIFVTILNIYKHIWTRWTSSKNTIWRKLRILYMILQ